jgi:hypothetical protein
VTSARRGLLASVVRILAMTVLLFVLYARAPLGSRPDAAVGAELAALLIVFAVVLAWQIQAVMKSSRPGLRAIEVVAVSVPLLIVLFASAYFVLEKLHPHSFTEPLTRVDAAYFSVTVLATVGFGDIAPVTQVARSMVTIQMLADLVLIGVVAKVLLGAVQRRRQALATGADQASGSPPPGASRAPRIREGG